MSLNINLEIVERIGENPDAPVMNWGHVLCLSSPLNFIGGEAGDRSLIMHGITHNLHSI